ncbi:hypothetical protein HUW51_02945 [Adhaeribacter swui]|uniref:Uncharacterized protein n=1 Tax=Adhaeribacter swui TaxID=2086471 RepID=A0A7G7G3J3_9BACT|nr:hypothetical protein [Adhaeribacter swui]QNF31727.1 hypothetical protein HUW51_02945 [Adhaeribacter swui]
MNTKLLSGLLLKTTFVFIIFMLGLHIQVSAQIAFVGNSQLKAETKRSKREAARIDSDYKETHLNTNYFTYKKGKASRKRVEVEETWEDYKYNNLDQFTYTEPVKLKIKRKSNRKKK